MRPHTSSSVPGEGKFKFFLLKRVCFLYPEGCSVAEASLTVGYWQCHVASTCALSRIPHPPSLVLDAVNTGAVGGRAWERVETRRQGTERL